VLLSFPLRDDRSNIALRLLLAIAVSVSRR
jgi:hypothetical protein